MMGLAKLAASFDARRNKQYWQMLKRLYGGTDEAIDAIKESGDTGIYHGTPRRNLEDIQNEGLLPGKGTYGHGVYFGTKQKSREYAPLGSEDFTVLRMKKPSELTGTSELYPDVNKMKSITATEYQGKEVPPEKLRQYQTYAVNPESKKKRFLNQDEMLFEGDYPPHLLKR